mgnify:CR=1 FL=1
MIKEMSPYGGEELLTEKLPVEWITYEYFKKSGIDVSEFFSGVNHVTLNTCSKTGYQYWKPYSIAGSELFYKVMASSTPFYYRSDRWEYPMVRKLLKKDDDILEISCGQGFFLKSIEGSVNSGTGIEFSQYAIDNKVTVYPIRAAMIEDIAKEDIKFDVVCSFQVLEHVVNPKEFIQGCLDVLKPDGRLVFSTPNDSAIAAQNKTDCWDLPPHHMGKYTEDIYRKIGEEFGLEILALKQQTRGAVTIPVTHANQKKLLYRVFKKLLAVTSRILFRVTNEPGHTIVCVFKRNA